MNAIFYPTPAHRFFSPSAGAHLSRDMAHSSSLASLWILHHRFGGRVNEPPWAGELSKNSSLSLYPSRRRTVTEREANVLSVFRESELHVVSAFAFLLICFSLLSRQPRDPWASQESQVYAVESHFTLPCVSGIRAARFHYIRTLSDHGFKSKGWRRVTAHVSFRKKKTQNGLIRTAKSR